jgi:hypothetical protein
MLLCALLMYARNSGELISTASDAQLVSDSMIRLANSIARRGAALVSHHVAVGAGTYLALIGSAVLAGQGVQRLRQSRATR